MLEDIGQYEQLAIEVAIKAGQMVKAMRGGHVEARHKGRVDLVTEADIKSQELIAAELKAAWPEFSFIAEEGERAIIESDYYWVVDPLDGTTNYSHGYPVYCVSIALMHQGDPIIGVVFDPNLDELFVGATGQNPTLNGSEIEVSKTSVLVESLLATGFPYDIGENPDRVLGIFNALTVRAQGIRRAGAAALDLCALACGRIDGFWESGLKPWDTAAAGFIAMSAGAKSSDFSGNPFDINIDEALFSNGIIHEQLLEVLSLA